MKLKDENNALKRVKHPWARLLSVPLDFGRTTCFSYTTLSFPPLFSIPRCVRFVGDIKAPVPGEQAEEWFGAGVVEASWSSPSQVRSQQSVPAQQGERSKRASQRRWEPSRLDHNRNLLEVRFMPNPCGSLFWLIPFFLPLCRQLSCIMELRSPNDNWQPLTSCPLKKKKENLQ